MKPEARSRAGLSMGISASNKVPRGTEREPLVSVGRVQSFPRIPKGSDPPNAESLAYSLKFLLTSEKTHLSVCLFSPNSILGIATPGRLASSPSDTCNPIQMRPSQPQPGGSCSPRSFPAGPSPTEKVMRHNRRLLSASLPP